MKIRRAIEADVPAILKVHHTAVHNTAAIVYGQQILETWSSGPTPERVKGLQGRIVSEEEIVFVAVTDDEILGFGSLVSNENELRAIYVHPDHGRKGVGGALVAKIESLAIDLGLTFLKMDASLNAEAFYIHHGFEVLEYSEHELNNGLKMPCVKMQKDIRL